MQQRNVRHAQQQYPRLGFFVVVAALLTLMITLTNFTPARAQSLTLPAGFNDQEVVYGLTQPTALAIAPDGRLFIAQKYGRVLVVKNGALLSAPFVALTNLRTEREWGLIGLALDPNFAQNGFVYLRYTRGSATVTPPTCRHLLSRFIANGDVAAANSEMILFDMGDCEGTGAHAGGTIHFGSDGKLYTSLGDQQSDPNNAQNLSNLFGKLLRLNGDGTIPTDNPFYTTVSGNNRAIWAFGLRNPFVFAIQPGTGRLYINDVGENNWEEINLGQAGANYGWPTCEGNCSPPNPTFIDPIYAYSHDAGCSITGGLFYNPPSSNFPSQYTGKYFFADWCGGWIRTLDPANNNVVNFADLALLGRPVDLDVASGGTLYWLSQDPNRGTGMSGLHRIHFSNLPGIARPPRSVTVNPGQNVTLNVIASGNAPFTYQWQRNGANITGATAASYNFAATQTDNGALYRVIVANAAGNATSQNAILTVRQVANNPPVGTITEPAEGARYHAGDTINFAGTATDPEDGTLPASAFTWEVVFHHAEHVHDFIDPIVGVKNGSFTLPTTGETDHRVWYRIHLTVRDAQGVTHTSTRDITPYKSTITLTTDPPGLRLTLDGQSVTAPYSTLGVEGIERVLGVVSPQTLNGVTYQWASWSDSGAATHTIATPAQDTTYTARFVAVTDVIFADDFESGNLSRWSARVTDSGDLQVNAAAALEGSRGMAAVLDDNTPLTVTDERPAGEKRYRMRFYFDPNSIPMNAGASHVIFFGYSGAGLTRPVLRVELRFFDGRYELRPAFFNDSTTWRASPWRQVSDGPHYVELDWQAATTAGANNGRLDFWIDGSLRATLTGVDNDSRRIDLVRLGAVAGIDAGTRGTYFLDAFESRRATAIGAAPTGFAVDGSQEEIDPATLTDYLDIDEQEPEEQELMREVLEQAEQVQDNTIFLPFVDKS